MPTDSLSQQPQATGTQFRVRNCPPPDHEVIDWFMMSVHPALKQLANSELSDFRLLNDAAGSLPAADRTAWQNLVRRLENEAPRFVNPNRPFFVQIIQVTWATIHWIVCGRESSVLYDYLHKLISDLNTNWFIPRSLLLYPYGEEQLTTVPVTNLWEAAGIALAMITQEQVYPFADGVIPVYGVIHLLPRPAPPSRRPCYYDPLLRMVVIDVAYTTRLMYEVKLGAKADNLIESYFSLSGRWDQEAPVVERTFCRWLDKRYPNLQDLCHCFSYRVLVEELRHGMDIIRIGCHAHADEYPQRLGDTLLTRSGRVRQLVWESIRSGRDAELWCGSDVAIEDALIELSAQMTAAAVADPGVILLGWWHKLALLGSFSSSSWRQRFYRRQHPGHTMAGILGTILLGEKLNCGPPLSWPILCEPDFAALSELAWRLANRPLDELRLALKTIYQNEFNYPIDELPFPEILPSGELRNRLPSQGKPTQAVEPR